MWIFSHKVMSNSLWSHGLQHARFPCFPLSPRVCSNSCPLSQWYHPTISSLLPSSSFAFKSFPASASFPMNWLFASGNHGIGASASVLPVSYLGLISFRGIFPLWHSNPATVHEQTSFVRNQKLIEKVLHVARMWNETHQSLQGDSRLHLSRDPTFL